MLKQRQLQIEIHQTATAISGINLRPQEEDHPMSRPDVILVAGATGKRCSSIARYLELLGKVFRVLVRDPNKLADFQKAEKPTSPLVLLSEEGSRSTKPEFLKLFVAPGSYYLKTSARTGPASASSITM
jgi:hypothetical protein